MKHRNWLVATGVGLAAVGTLVTATPAIAAGTAGSGASFDCSYTVDRHTKTVTGECSGSTPFGEASGVLTGSVTGKGGSVSGYFTISTPLGYSDGSFEGTFSPSGGSASGTFYVEGPGGSCPGAWIGSER